MQKMVTEGKGLETPIQKLHRSVTEVMVMDTAASLSIWAILSGTAFLIEVLLHAANVTKVSSIPIPMFLTPFWDTLHELTNDNYQSSEMGLPN